MVRLNRRQLIAAAGLTGVGLLAGGPRAAGVDRALRVSARRAVRPEGTTLEQVATPVGSAGYRRLATGPGWPLVVRQELAPAGSRRDDRREALASAVQFTDVHVVDAESPVRAEYMHLFPVFASSAFRPHETMTTQGLASLVSRVNGLRAGPFTGRPFDCLVSTGDNTDNHEHVELSWFLDALNGGEITPATGDRTRYEGVQDSGSTLYYHPESDLNDIYKQAGFPQIPGLLTAAARRFTSAGLEIPWYSVFGNHDDSVEGTVPGGTPLDAFYTGTIKIMGLSSPAAAEKIAGLWQTDPRQVGALIPVLAGPIATVTADQRRKPFTPLEYVLEHLKPRNTGPGPVGHGFTQENVDRDTGYFTWEVAPGVLGIAMDTTNRAGFTDGSLGAEQLEWIEARLKAGSSAYYDPSGRPVTHDVTDSLFVLFSHHTSTTMENVIPDPERPAEQRHNADVLIALLHRFPNVVAWVCGHTHTNLITPHAGPTAEQGFWEISTASHVDYPQQARLLELVDNRDGTLSLFATLIEADSPYQVGYGNLSPGGLASLYRELAFNDIHNDGSRTGGPADHNVELLLANPLR